MEEIGGERVVEERGRERDGQEIEEARDVKERERERERRADRERYMEKEWE